jgi:hypothetical protein
MKREFVLGVAALVASCLFAQDVFAQRSGSRGLGEAGLCYYAGSDLPYVPVGTPPVFLAGHAGKIDSCWAWDGYQWRNTCERYYP